MKITLSKLRTELARVFPGDEPSLTEHGPDGIRWHHMIAEPRGVQMIPFFRTDKAVKQHEGLRALKSFLECLRAQKGKAA